MRYFGIDKDEIHKFVRWKSFLKGFFDLYEDRTSLIVTGSARLDIYKRGGDSLMGRYFLYHMHPLGVAETTVKTWTATLEYFHEGFRGRPWFLVEAKLSDVRLSPALASMQKATGAAHAFQVVRDLPYADADAFSHRDPISVSARSFLSQLF